MSYSAAVITVSDKGFRGERVDTSGPALCALLEENGWQVEYRAIVPDEAEAIQKELLKCADELGVALALTTGGTGFSPRDITPEATRAIAEREVPGIPEAMRAESMRITPNGCLSRSFAGIRGRTLMVNLPGSEKAARENLTAVLPPLRHGLKMLLSEGSADCAAKPDTPVKRRAPAMDEWLRDAKNAPGAENCGMFLFHCGVVRSTARAEVREKLPSGKVLGMEFSYDAPAVADAEERARQREGVYYVRTWLNAGRLDVGDDIMLVLVGGDTRPHVLAALDALVAELKSRCVTEKEIF